MIRADRGRRAARTAAFLAHGPCGRREFAVIPPPSESKARSAPIGTRRFLENGAIAQLGERFNGIEEVVGSIPSGSTKNINNLSSWSSPSCVLHLASNRHLVASTRRMKNKDSRSARPIDRIRRGPPAQQPAKATLDQWARSLDATALRTFPASNVQTRKERPSHDLSTNGRIDWERTLELITNLLPWALTGCHAKRTGGLRIKIFCQRDG